MHDLFEVLLGQVHVAQDFAFEAALALRQDQVDQFGELQVDGRVVVGEQVVAQSGIDRGEEVFQRGPSRGHDVRLLFAFGTAVVVGDRQLVGQAQVVEDPGELFRGVVEDHLLEIPAAGGNVLGVVGSGTEVENLARAYRMAHVAVVDVFGAAPYIAYAVPCQRVRLDSDARRLDILDHRRLLRDRGNGFGEVLWHILELFILRRGSDCFDRNPGRNRAATGCTANIQCKI